MGVGGTEDHPSDFVDPGEGSGDSTTALLDRVGWSADVSFRAPVGDFGGSIAGDTLTLAAAYSGLGMTTGDTLFIAEQPNLADDGLWTAIGSNQFERTETGIVSEANAGRLIAAGFDVAANDAALMRITSAPLVELLFVTEEAVDFVVNETLGDYTPTADLGGAALLDVGQQAGQVMAADDSRVWDLLLDETLSADGDFTEPDLTGYSFIEILVFGRTLSTIAATDGVRLTLNGNSGSVYGANAAAFTTSWTIGTLPSSQTNGDRSGMCKVELQLAFGRYITGYTLRDLHITDSATVGATAGITTLVMDRGASPAPITSMDLFTGSGTSFAAGSRAIIRGRV